ncbi:hypothetical protein M3Y97_00926300 [Aphelenchoides bicaudatus]|nr:hypothetical protein M3Y97_00926300 [Aphelenchoides bicaudatus]
MALFWLLFLIKFATGSADLLRFSLHPTFVGLKVGTPPALLWPQFNTDIPHTWIGVTKCTLNNSCSSKIGGYSPITSSTAKFNGTDECADELQFPNSTPPLKQFKFRAVPKGLGIDAEIGLSPDTMSSPFSFVKQAMNAGIISKPEATIRYDPCGLERNKCKRHDEIVFGGADTENCATDGQPLQLEKDEKQWEFEVVDYSFVYNATTSSSFGERVMQKISTAFSSVVKFISHIFSPSSQSYSKAQNSTKLTIYFNHTRQNTQLPNYLQQKLFEVTGLPFYTNYVNIPCGDQFQFKFKLRDSKNTTVEWTLNKEDFMPLRIMPANECLLYIKGTDSSVDNQIQLDASIFRSACVHYDFEKREMTLNRRVK